MYTPPNSPERALVFDTAKRVGIELKGSDDRERSIWLVIKALIDRIEVLENAIKKDEPDRVSGFDVDRILRRDGG